jgi:hypothetical protein
MRKGLTYVFLFLLGLVSYFVVSNYPFNADVKQLEPLSDTSLIIADLRAITGHTQMRNYVHTEVLDSVADYIKQQFDLQQAVVTDQPFEVGGRRYRNVIGSFGPVDAPRIIIGAHYDVCGKQEGADDNASGVAGILALARLLKGTELTNRIDLVTYSLEEPPFFGTDEMGSYIHAKSLKDQKAIVKGVISVEMIGYFSDSVGSQDYPVGLLSSLYGDKGDYITVVKKLRGGDFAKAFKDAYFNNNTLPAKAFSAPTFVGGIDLSDHRNYWRFGYDAVMLTNTAFYRNHQYHLAGDTVDRLDIRRMGLVVDGLYRAIAQMQ